MERVLDTKTFIVLGEGLAAGVGHFTLTEDVQAWSFPAQVAKQLGTSFRQPLIQPPGVGNVGFQKLPAMVPDLLQTTVLKDFPHDKADLSNLSVLGFTVADALERRPKAPLIQTDDPKQTLINLILGIPGLTNGKRDLPTQVEYAKARKPTFVLIALGYQELLEPLVEGHIHGGQRSDLRRFAEHYKRVLDELSGPETTILVTTIPNPLDTAYFSSLETAAKILRTEVPFLQNQYDFDDGDLINLEGLVEVGYEFTARQLSGKVPESMVVSAAEAKRISQGVQTLNSRVIALAEEKAAIVYDLHGFFRRVGEHGIEVGGKQLTGGFLGGVYLLNGVYPGRTGHALIANEIVTLLNEHFGRGFKTVDVAEVIKDDANALSKIADGPTFTDEYLKPRTPVELPPLPPPDPSAINFYPPFDPKKFNVYPVQTTYPDPPFDIGGTKAANQCVPKKGIPAGGLSEPKLKKPLRLPEGLQQTLPLNKKGSYYGDALRPVDFPDEKPFLPGLPTFGANGNTFFGGLAMVDSHLSGKIHITFSEPNEHNVTKFEVTHPGGLVGDDGVLAAPQFFKLPSQLNRVLDVPGLVSAGELNLDTGIVTNLRYSLIFLNTQTLTLFGVNPKLPVGPLVFPGPPNGGSSWARFEQRDDGKLDFTFAGNLFLPLGKEFDGEPVRFPLPFSNPHLQCASIIARGTSLHPHIHLTTKETPRRDCHDNAPAIPVNTVREFTTFVHNNNFGDIFGFHINELGGHGTGRTHLMGRLRIQFGPRSGDSVPFAVSFLPPGGLLNQYPKSLPYLPPGTPRGMIGFNEQLKFPSGVIYHQRKLASAMDPNNLQVGAVDLKTGWVWNEFLNRGFIVQQLFVNLIQVEPCTPGDSFNFQGPARFETGPNGELIFSFNGEVYVPYPKGFKFPSPSEDGMPGFVVVEESRLDPFLRLQAMHGGQPSRNVLTSGGAAIDATSSIGQRFSYRYSIPCDPGASDDAFFDYTNHEEEGTFRLTSLSWLRATNSRNSIAGDGMADTVTFGGFGTWSKDSDLHQVSVHISTASDEPYVGIQVDGGTTSNVNTKPEDIEATIPL